MPCAAPSILAVPALMVPALALMTLALSALALHSLALPILALSVRCLRAPDPRAPGPRAPGPRAPSPGSSCCMPLCYRLFIVAICTRTRTTRWGCALACGGAMGLAGGPGLELSSGRHLSMRRARAPRSSARRVCSGWCAWVCVGPRIRPRGHVPLGAGWTATGAVCRAMELRAVVSGPSGHAPGI